MKTLLIIIAPIFFSWSALAIGDFSGHWVGPGNIVSTVGQSANCPSIEITISQTADKIVIEKYKSTCDLYGSTWGPVDLNIVGDKIFEDGEQTGTIVDGALLTSESDSGVIYIFNLKLITQNGTTTMETDYGVRNFVGTISTLGTLTRIP